MKYIRYEVVVNGHKCGVFSFLGAHKNKFSPVTLKLWRQLRNELPAPPRDLFEEHNYKTLSYFKERGNELFAAKLKELFRMAVKDCKLDPETTKLKVFNKIKIGEIVFEDNFQILSKKVEKLCTNL